MSFFDSIRRDHAVIGYLIVTVTAFIMGIIDIVVACLSQQLWILAMAILFFGISVVYAYLTFRQYQKEQAEKILNFIGCEHIIIVRASDCLSGPRGPVCPSSDMRACTRKCIIKDLWGKNR